MTVLYFTDIFLLLLFCLFYSFLSRNNTDVISVEYKKKIKNYSVIQIFLLVSLNIFHFSSFYRCFSFSFSFAFLIHFCRVIIVSMLFQFTITDTLYSNSPCLYYKKLQVLMPNFVLLRLKTSIFTLRSWHTSHLKKSNCFFLFSFFVFSIFWIPHYVIII